MPRYVILEHASNGVHWDIMLEVGDTLRTWAVDVPIAPGWAIPARTLANHRVAYLDYEGPISRDRGTVKSWDSGTYRVLEWSETVVRVALAGHQLLGLMELCAVAGTAGSWSLVFLPGRTD